MSIHIWSSYLIVNAHLSCRDGRILSRESSESVRDLEEYLLKFRSRRRDVTMQEDRDFPNDLYPCSLYACLRRHTARESFKGHLFSGH